MELIQKNAATVKILKKNPGTLIMCSLLDALFFILYGLTTFPFFKTMETALVQMFDTLAIEIDNIMNGQATASGLADIFFNPLVRKELIMFAFMGIFAVLIIYFLYSGLHGYCWQKTKELIHPRQKGYLSKFFKINIFWFVLLVVLQIIDLFFDVRHSLIERVTGTSTNYLDYVFVGAGLVIIYFVLLSYVFLSIKKAFKQGLDKYKTYAPIYLNIILIFLVINLIMIAVGKIDRTLTFIVGIVLFLPAMTYARSLILMSKE